MEKTINEELSSIKQELKKLSNQKQLNSKEVLSFEEAVKHLNVSKSFLYKMTSEGKIAFSKPSGKLIYFKKTDLDNWMLSNRSESIEEIEMSINEKLKVRR